jgi:alcohol-forming fatty acyl-CoA reductase
VIEGDASKINLGISDEDLEKIKSCSVIFHAAASVRFDDPLKSAILMNTRGTREVCRIAQTMPNLKAFIHISTTYIRSDLIVEEKIYPCDFDWKTFIKLAETLDDDVMNSVTGK